MRTLGRLGVAACFVAYLFSGLATAQQITFRPNPNAPLSPTTRSEDEYTAYLTVQDQRDPRRMVRLATEFLSNYDSSEYRHLVLRLRFRGRLEQGEEDWEDIVESAEEGLAAEELYTNGKLRFIDDPEALDEWPAFQLDMANQRMVYYQALANGYMQLEKPEQALMNSELALDALAEVWDLFSQQNEPGSSAYEEAEARTMASKESLLRTVLAVHRQNQDEAGVLDTSRKLLELRPDDLELLMVTTQMMAQSTPSDPEEAGPYFEAAADYATRAIAGLKEWMDSDESALVNERVKRDYLVEAHSNLGLIHFQTGDYAGAAVAFGDAVAVYPDDPVLHYRLGVAYNNSQNVDGAASELARAVFLGFDDARQALESVYQAKTGGLDGLDEFIETEGQQITP